MRFWITLEVIGIAFSLFVLGMSVRLAPDPHAYGTTPKIFEPCAYRLQTGRPCLSCGMTTAFSNMARLRPADAWTANPAGIPLFLLTLVTPFWLLHAAWTGKDPLRFTRGRLGRWILPLLATFIVAVWVDRNLFS